MIDKVSLKYFWEDHKVTISVVVVIIIILIIIISKNISIKNTEVSNTSEDQFNQDYTTEEMYTSYTEEEIEPDETTLTRYSDINYGVE
jgi:hypothetical protein